MPAFHAAAFARTDHPCAVLNLGGMANLSVIHADGRVTGFDTGPGGVLLDGWCERHQGTSFDTDGRWARSGSVKQQLLHRLMVEPYFAVAPPKSTGREMFNLAWLDAALTAHGVATSAVDVQATLSELTAQSVTQAMAMHGSDAQTLIVCGGGARNADLLARLQRQSPRCRIVTSDAFGMPVDQVEAIAFAWLAQRFVQRQPGNLVAVTGARGERVLGCLHPAR